jgi:hypothetical protein
VTPIASIKTPYTSLVLEIAKFVSRLPVMYWDMDEATSEYFKARIVARYEQSISLVPVIILTPLEQLSKAKCIARVYSFSLTAVLSFF